MFAAGWRLATAESLCAWLRLLIFSCSFLLVQCKKVYIIGSGISGLSAARALVNEGHEVTVFEGNRHRWGGRIRTETLSIGGSSYPVDLGAAWVYADMQNPLYQIVTKYRLATFQTDFQNLSVYKDGQHVPQMKVGEVLKNFTDIMKQVKSKASHFPVNDTLEEGLLTLKSYESLKDVDIASLIIANNIDFVNHASISNLSARFFHRRRFSGAPNMLVDGFATLIHHVIKGGKDEQPLRIRLGTRVTRISHQPRNVELQLDNEKELRDADAVIVTVPLGVLKAGAIHFEPPLPERKQLAIDRLGFGASNRIVIEFTHAFWPDAESTQIFGLEETGEGEGKLASVFYNMYPVSRKPILVTFAVGKSAKLIESMRDSELRAKILDNLKKMFGRESVQRATLVTVKTSRWSQDENSLGSATYSSAGSLPCDWKYLAQAHCSQFGHGVFFAGEHTSFDYPGAAGAYISGQRAAQEFMDNVCKFKDPPSIDCSVDVSAASASFSKASPLILLLLLSHYKNAI